MDREFATANPSTKPYCIAPPVVAQAAMFSDLLPLSRLRVFCNLVWQTKNRSSESVSSGSLAAADAAEKLRDCSQRRAPKAKARTTNTATKRQPPTQCRAMPQGSPLSAVVTELRVLISGDFVPAHSIQDRCQRSGAVSKAPSAALHLGFPYQALARRCPDLPPRLIEVLSVFPAKIARNSEYCIACLQSWAFRTG